MRQVFGWLGSCPETKRTFLFLRYGLAPVAADEYISYCSENVLEFFLCVGIIII